ncbi:MAG: Asp23/Gls24 family envelope stress response protein [Sciscionella sp.]
MNRDGMESVSQSPTPSEEDADYQRAAESQRCEVVIAPATAAAIAAHAAAATPGVKRLETGVAGLVSGWQRAARGRWAGLHPAPVAGASATVDDGVATVAVAVNIAVAGGHRVADVAVAVRRAVIDAVTANTGLSVTAVSVSVLDIEVPPGGGR